MNKDNIIISEDWFVDACDAETCMIWANDFLNSDRTIEFEIDDIKGTIKNEELVILGCNEKWEAEMHEDNLKDYYAYLEWLKSINI